MDITPLSISNDLRGVRILLRAALNVPLEDGTVTNALRLARSLSTVEALASRGARIVVMGHIGRDPTASLLPVFKEAQRRSSLPLLFSDDITGRAARGAAAALKDGEVLFLENVRRDVREVKNDDTFARELASLADIFVNDAFADSHRAHTSIVGVPRHIPGFAGERFMEEYRALSAAQSPKSPSLAIVGGAKFLTKEPLLKTLLAKYDRVFIGGALANDFFKAQGFSVGKSLVSPESSAQALLKNSKIIVPVDVAVETPSGREVKTLSVVEEDDVIYDIGPASIKALAPHIEKARSILWNGPLGNFEVGFVHATEELARLIARASAHSIVGGGDTVFAIEHLRLSDRFSFVSTAGGAMLQFIAEGTLPGIEALKRKPN